MPFPSHPHPVPSGTASRARRLRLEDLCVPLPRPQEVQRFQAAYLRLYGQPLEPKQAADFLHRILIVAHYRQLSETTQQRPSNS